ncbi:Receptor-interacting serine/threonine-protein kinase 3 [Anabarilius grahami]|uniref:Receptor-interacting serine/threonine-protein kinase 3 n=1 Tax=Anabarilius grahami TaxID=495550 RepID=A0A3N0Y2L7_ANAGA|nr:Receptor-interacting serine/threonine-protein kinase 3 [Anabarilius grahami]
MSYWSSAAALCDCCCCFRTRAEITDFGLSRVAQSVSKGVRQKDEDEGGTLSYMPPEALQSVNYKASRASDVYSYGVLLWSIITGKEPYDGKASSLVRFCIPRGGRPDVTLIDCSQTEGLEDLLKLMKRCWDQDANKRPTFLDCVNVTEKIFELHQRGLSDAVRDVLKQLETAAGYTNTVKKGGVHINMSNVFGVQVGNNNYMNIVQKPRQRHRTAPSSVNTSENAQKKP